MFGLSFFGVFVFLLPLLLVFVAAFDYIASKRRLFGSGYYSGTFTFFVTVVLFLPTILIMAGVRRCALVSFNAEMKFKDPIILENDMKDSAVLFRVREETIFFSRTIDVLVNPGEVSCLSSSTGGYYVLYSSMVDNETSDINRKYESIVESRNEGK